MATYRININGKQYKVKGDMETLVGRKKIFQSLGISIPKESPTITDNGFTYTYGSKPKAVIGSETLKELKINTRKGIDMYLGRNRSKRYDKASADMGNTWMFHPLDYIKPTYWNSLTHKAVKEGGDIAAVVASAPLTVYTGVQASPYIFNGLKVAGLAMTPSTWINGIGRAAGYNLDKAGTIADLAASAYFANEAGKEIDLNGLTWRTGFNALMSLAPMTRETEAIEGVANAVRRPMSSVSSVVDDFRAARNAVSSPEAVVGREFNRSVKNTQFVNVPVEHVSPNGITRGSALDVREEGIHLSPTGSPTTYTIQRTTGYPFVRTGTWTFSTNTRPVEVLDMGYFGKGFNPDFDTKVNNGVTNFKYTNNFEGNGNTSYLTIEPNWGLLLSKNSIASNSNKGYGKWFTLHLYPEHLRDIILLPNGLLQRHRIGIENTIEDLVTTPLTPYEEYKGYSIDFDNYATNIRPYERWLLDYFNSGFYARRLAKSGLLDLRDAILLHNNEMLGKVRYYEDPTLGRAIAATTRYLPYEESFGTAIRFNSDYDDQKIGYNVYHEGKHAVDINSPINNHNSELVKDGRDYLNIPYEDLSIDDRKYIDYLLSIDPRDGVVEMAGLLQPALIHMQLHKLTPRLLINSDYHYKDKSFHNILKHFNRDYIEKLLSKTGILATLPLITNDNK